jgi:hypothetical protein
MPEEDENVFGNLAREQVTYSGLNTHRAFIFRQQKNLLQF